MRVNTERHRRAVAVAVAALVLAGCSSATALRTPDVTSRRATWTARKLTDYSYDYELRGFFIAFAGRPIRVVVRGNAVQSATDVQTGQPVNAPLSTWPTIDALFARAEQAAADGALKRITYDSTLGYPTEIDLAGPPDASGSILASNLVPAS